MKRNLIDLYGFTAKVDCVVKLSCFLTDCEQDMFHSKLGLWHVFILRQITPSTKRKQP